jgi:hypothetical protein
VFARDRQDAIVDLDLDVVRVDARDVGAHGQGLVTPVDVDRRRPGAALTVEPALVGLIELPAQRVELASGIVGNSAGGMSRPPSWDPFSARWRRRA